MLTNVFVTLFSGDKELGLYGYLYNCVPPSPAIVVFSMQFNVGQDTLPAGIVYSMMVGGPILLVVALMSASNVHDVRSEIMDNHAAFGNLALISFITSVALMCELIYRGITSPKTSFVLRWLLPILVWQTMATMASASALFGPMCIPASNGYTQPSSLPRSSLFIIGLCAAKMWTAALAVQMALTSDQVESMRGKQQSHVQWKTVWVSTLAATIAVTVSTIYMVRIQGDPGSELKSMGCFVGHAGPYFWINMVVSVTCAVLSTLSLLVYLRKTELRARLGFLISRGTDAHTQFTMMPVSLSSTFFWITANITIQRVMLAQPQVAIRRL